MVEPRSQPPHRALPPLAPLAGAPLAKCIHPCPDAPTCAGSSAAGIRQRRSLASVCYALCLQRVQEQSCTGKRGTDERHPSVLLSLSLHQRHQPSPLTLSCLSPPMRWGFPAEGPSAPGPFHSLAVGRQKGPGEEGRAGGHQEPGQGNSGTAELGFGVLGSRAGMAASVPQPPSPASKRS